MNFSGEGTQTGRIPGSRTARSNRPKAAESVGEGYWVTRVQPNNGAPRFEMVGMHLGPRTKQTDPYSYDPLLQFATGEKPDGSCYSDRLLRWYGYDTVRQKMQQHFGNGSDYYDGRSPQAIEAFLRDLMGKPNLKLVRIEEHCNASNGYPVWFFAYQSGDESAAG